MFIYLYVYNKHIPTNMPTRHGAYISYINYRRVYIRILLLSFAKWYNIYEYDKNVEQRWQRRVVYIGILVVKALSVGIHV